MSQFRELGVTQKIITNSTALYRERYAEQLRERKHYTYSQALRGNTHGKREAQVQLSRTAVQSLIDSGYSIRQIAQRLKTSEWFVRRSMQQHGLDRIRSRGVLPYRMVDSDLAYLERLERYSPGILKAVHNFYNDPHTFFLKLYEALTQVVELLWFIKDQSKTYHGHRGRGTVPRDHICWSLNRHELLLSTALLAAKIPHIRQVVLYKNYITDFAFPPTNLLVEVDGSFHELKDTKRRDRIKRIGLTRMGYRTLHFTTRQVETQLPQVIDRIRSALAESRKSRQSESKPFGTSKSKKTIRT